MGGRSNVGGDIAAAVHGRAGLGRYAESLARALVALDPERFPEINPSGCEPDCPWPIGADGSYQRVIELDPLEKAVVWEYRASPPESFYTASRGSSQRLPNGNTLICVSDGGRAFEGAPNPMQPVVKLKARILQVRTIPPGDTVGYGATYEAKAPTRVATIACGYADGFLRALSGSHGHPGPIGYIADFPVRIISAA